MGSSVEFSKTCVIKTGHSVCLKNIFIDSMILKNCFFYRCFAWRSWNYAVSLCRFPCAVSVLCGVCRVKNFDAEEYYTSYDIALLADKVVAHLAFLTMSWRNMLGRPTISVVICNNHLGNITFQFYSVIFVSRNFIIELLQKN